jgi:hypothetical protein
VNRKKRIAIATAALGGTLLLTAGACGPTAEETARNQLQAQKSTGDTLEKKNLEEKRKREENPNAVRYLYLYSHGTPQGYYITRGKVSSNGSQRTPEQDNMWTCGGTSGNYGCQPIVVDGAQDDGSYGAPEPGIFFFLANGTMISTTLDYVQADQPIVGVNVPLLGGAA